MVALENANVANSELLHFRSQPLVVLAELRVRMRVGCSREPDPFRDREPDDLVGGIKFVDRFAPAGGGELDRETARGDQIERRGNEVLDRRLRAMAMNLDEVEMGETIDQARRGDLANAAKIIRVNFIDIAFGELFGASRHAVEHLIGAVEIMDRAENEVEPVPVFLHPRAPGCGSFRIVIELNPGVDLHLRIRRAQFIDLVEIDPGVIAIVISKGDIGQAPGARAIDPRLEKRLSVRLDSMTLRMGVIVGKQLRVNS